MRKVISIIVLISFLPVFLFCEEDVNNNNLLHFDVETIVVKKVNSLSPAFDVRPLIFFNF